MSKWILLDILDDTEERETAALGAGSDMYSLPLLKKIVRQMGDELALLKQAQ